MKVTKTISSRPDDFFPWLLAVWKQKSLILTFAKRDLKVQYAQTFLGLFWVLLQPLAGLLVFTLFFGQWVKVDTGSMPYPLFAFSGMVCWYFFSYMISHGGSSLMNNAELIRKLAFPRLVLPLSRVITGLAEFGVSLSVLFLMMIFQGKIPGLQILALPVFILLNILAGLGISIALSAISLRYRDFHHILPYLVQFGIWITPVFYPQTLIPEKWRFLLFLNPMAGIISGFRWTLLGGPPPEAEYIFSFIGLFLILLFALMLFRRNEHKAADWL